MSARRRFRRVKPVNQERVEVKTRKMFGHDHTYDETLQKWVRVA